MIPLIHFYKESNPTFHHKKCDQCNKVTEDFTGFEHYMKTPYTGRDVYCSEIADKSGNSIINQVETCKCNFCTDCDNQYRFSDQHMYKM